MAATVNKSTTPCQADDIFQPGSCVIVDCDLARKNKHGCRQGRRAKTVVTVRYRRLIILRVQNTDSFEIPGTVEGVIDQKSSRKSTEQSYEQTASLKSLNMLCLPQRGTADFCTTSINLSASYLSNF